MKFLGSAAILLIVLLCSDISSAAKPVGITHYAKANITKNHCASMRLPNESVYLKQVTGDCESEPCQRDVQCKCTTPCPCPNRAKDLSPEYAIEIEDGFIISLHQAFIKDFPEWNLFGKKAGDIAIVATVKERTNGTDFDFTSQAATNGRVVFYQQNVGAGTTLNLSNVPVYGPAKYGGFPVMITLHVIEIDEGGSKRAAGIVSKLAELSRTIPTVSTKALGILDTLGTSLLSQNKNDVLARYDMELSPYQDMKSGLMGPTLEYGNYAFVVGEGEDNNQEWEQVFFDQRNSRLHKNSTCNSPFGDKTWLTFQINKASSERLASLSSTNTLGALLESIGRDAQADIQRATTLVTDLQSHYAQHQVFEQSVKVIERMRSTDRSKWTQELKTQLGNIVDQIASSITDIKAGNKGGKFNSNQCKRLVSVMRPLVAVPNNVLVSYEAFDSTTVKQLLGI